MNVQELPPFPKKGVSLKLLQHVRDIVGKVDKSATTTQVCDFFIKPITKSEQVSFADVNFASISSIEKENSRPQNLQLTSSQEYVPNAEAVKYCSAVFRSSFKLSYEECFGDRAHVFISHAWRYVYAELVDAIESFFHEHPELNPSTTYVWFDMFLNNQWKACDLPFEWWCGTFRSAIKEIGHVCLVLLPWQSPIPLTRAWCLFEILSTRVTGSKLTIQLNSTQKKLFLEKLRNDFHLMLNIFGNIDVAKSTAFLQADTDRILEAVQRADGGFASVNNTITEAIRDWMRQTAAEEVQKVNEAFQAFLQQTNNNATATSSNVPFDVHVGSNTAEKLGKLLIEHGKYSEAEQVFSTLHEQRKALLGENHPETLRTLYELAILCGYSGSDAKRVVEMEKLESLLKLQSKALGDDDADTLHTMNALAALYDSQYGRHEEAIQLYTKVFQGFERLYGAYHTDTVHVRLNLAVAKGCLAIEQKDKTIFEETVHYCRNLLIELREHFTNSKTTKQQDQQDEEDKEAANNAFNENLQFIVTSSGALFRFSGVLKRAIPVFGYFNAVLMHRLLRVSIDSLIPFVGEEYPAIITRRETLADLLKFCAKEYFVLHTEVSLEDPRLLPEDKIFLSQSSDTILKEVEQLENYLILAKQKVYGVLHLETQKAEAHKKLEGFVAQANSVEALGKPATVEGAQQLAQLTELVNQLHFGGQHSASTEASEEERMKHLFDEEQAHARSWIEKESFLLVQMREQRKITSSDAFWDTMESVAESCGFQYEETIKFIVNLSEPAVLTDETDKDASAQTQPAAELETTLKICSEGLLFYTSETNSTKHTSNRTVIKQILFADVVNVQEQQHSSTLSITCLLADIPINSSEESNNNADSTISYAINTTTFSCMEQTPQILQILTKNLQVYNLRKQWTTVSNSYYPMSLEYHLTQHADRWIQIRWLCQLFHEHLERDHSKSFHLNEEGIARHADILYSFAFVCKQYQAYDELIRLCEVLLQSFPRVCSLDTLPWPVKKKANETTRELFDRTVSFFRCEVVVGIYCLLAEGLSHLKEGCIPTIQHIHWIHTAAKQCSLHFGPLDLTTQRLTCCLADLLSRRDAELRQGITVEYGFCKTTLQAIGQELDTLTKQELWMKPAQLLTDVSKKVEVLCKVMFELIFQRDTVWFALMLMLTRYDSEKEYGIAKDIWQKHKGFAVMVPSQAMDMINSMLDEQNCQYLNRIQVRWQQHKIRAFNGFAFNAVVRADFLEALQFKAFTLQVFQSLVDNCTLAKEPVTKHQQLACYETGFELASVFVKLNKLTEAEQALNDIIAQQESTVGYFQPVTLQCLHLLFSVHLTLRKFVELKTTCEKYIIRCTILGEGNSAVALEVKSGLTVANMVLGMQSKLPANSDLNVSSLPKQ